MKTKKELSKRQQIVNDLPLILLRFLLEKGLLSDYVSNCIDQFDSYNYWKNKRVGAPTMYLHNSFPWALAKFPIGNERKAQFDTWSKINREYYKYYWEQRKDVRESSRILERKRDDLPNYEKIIQILINKYDE